MEEKFKPLIDGRNADLWKLLREQYHISLKESDEPSYICHFEPDTNKAVISVNMENILPAAFTHELLHLYLKYKGVLIAGELAEKIAERHQLYLFFSVSLQTHVGNALEHYQMLPLYLERGFKREDFVTDHDQRIMDQESLQELQANFLQHGRYDRKVTDTYIGKFFSMKASSNPEYDYSACFLGLQKIDTTLYATLESFWQSWEAYNIHQGKEGYQEMLQDFLTALTPWARDKALV